MRASSPPAGAGPERPRPDTHTRSICLRIALTAVVLLLTPLPLAAQRIEPSVHAGLRAPTGGELVVPVPVPASSGFSAIPRSFTETGGVTVGAGARIRLTGTLGVATGLSATFAQRDVDANILTNCNPCSSTLLSALLGLSARRSLTERLRLDGTLGGELIRLGGDAHDAPMDVGSFAGVEATRRTVGASVASLGAAYMLRGGSALRLDVQLRRYTVTYRWTDPSFVTLFGAPTSTPYTDVRVTLGWRP